MPLHSQKLPLNNSAIESKADTELLDCAHFDELDMENFDDDGGVLAVSNSNLTPEQRHDFWNRAQFRSTKDEEIELLRQDDSPI